MAVRNKNDRNARALSARKQKASGTFTTTDGTNRVIKLKDKPDLLFIQQTIHDVAMPDPPTYEVQVGSRTKEYPLDVVVIQQTEDPLEKAQLRRKWMQYQTDLTEASMELSLRSTAAVFYEGTLADEEMIDNDAKWQRKVRIARYKVPEDLEERWVFYLQTSLTEDDVKELSTAVVRRAGGVSEEMISAAEEMFLGDLSTGDGAGDMADPEADQGKTA